MQAVGAGVITHGKGKVTPVLAPDVRVVRHDGVFMTLLPLLKGHATALHLMFTSCTTTCPIEAAIFEKVQTMLPGMAEQGIQLVSLSIDPEDDTPKALSAWRHHFHAGPNWIAASPAIADLTSVQNFFGNGKDSYDHTTQVQILDRSARLVWRTNELPTPGEITTVLQKIAG
jgi:protein SCO1/2